jgi:NAD(P)-dependent dehydrogenase (short-subunit alcohol dehydrogenase family)
MVDRRLGGAPDPQAALAALSRVNPLGRLGREEEIAELAAYLLGDGSRWTTGTVIPIDGGADAVM